MVGQDIKMNTCFVEKENLKSFHLKLKKITMWSIYNIFGDTITYIETHCFRAYFRKMLLAWIFFYKGPISCIYKVCL